MKFALPIFGVLLSLSLAAQNRTDSVSRSWPVVSGQDRSRAGAADRSSPPTLSFGSDKVTVTSVTPGADVYLFSVAREPKGYYNDIVTRELILHDSGKTGQVDYPLGRSLPLRSIWFAVDLTSGLSVAGVPLNYPAHLITLDSHHLRRDAAGDIVQLSYEGALVDTVFVRPGSGVWGATVGLRSRSDEGSDDHAVAISTLHLEPRVGTTAPAPEKLKNGDVIFLMNSFTAQYSMATVSDK